MITPWLWAIGLWFYLITAVFFNVNALKTESLKSARRLKPKQVKTDKSKKSDAAKIENPSTSPGETGSVVPTSEAFWSTINDDFVYLLIKWKVIEDFYENDKIDFMEDKEKEPKKFSEILKRKTNLMNQNSDVDNDLSRFLEELDDSNVRVTVDIPPVGITAVYGPVSYFEELELQQNKAVDLIEIDNFDNYIDEDVEKFLPINKTDRVLQSSQSEEHEPYGIHLVQALSVPASDYLMKGCVVDTGYDDGHFDLPSSTNPQHHVQGLGMQYEENWYDDFHGHGTHVAGTMFAISNGVGVIGVNDDPTRVGVVIGKGLKKNGGGHKSFILDAIYKCYLEGAQVINLSFGGKLYSQVTESFLDDMYNENILIVAAAGNSGNKGDSSYRYPASHSSVISVASVNSDSQRSPFSTFNDQVEVAAPGSNVISTYPGNQLYSLSGTSMAAPHVAGILLKVWAHFPQCSNTQMRHALIKSASFDEDCNDKLGFGIVNANRMYDNLSKYGCDYGGFQEEWDEISILPSELAGGGCSASKYFSILSPPVEDTDSPFLSPPVEYTDSPFLSPPVEDTDSPTPINVPTRSPTKKPIFQKKKKKMPPKRLKKKKKKTRSPTNIPTNTLTGSPTLKKKPPKTPFKKSKAPITKRVSPRNFLPNAPP